MKHRERTFFSFSIGLRIALISWLIAIGTLAVFILVLIPQQKTVFLRNLESKSRSVEASLYNAIAGAAINENFVNLISTSRALIEGDKDLEFLVIVKNNEFAVVNQREGWKLEKDINEFWLPETRQSLSAIATAPVLNRQVFHHAHPLDFSGIEWGWIHVGVTLRNYNRDVTHLYRYILWLGFLCAIVSLLVCLGYAHQLVKPIVLLQEVVHQITSGNLNVRADTARRDEIGSLADSVNIMAEGLLHRDNILDSVRYAAEHFLHGSEWETVIPDILEKMGQAVDACRVYIFENHTNDAGQLCMSQRYEWVTDNVTSQLSNPELQNLPYADSGLDRQTISLLSHNDTLSMTLSEMSDETRAIVEPQGIYSILFVPIIVEKSWWGYIGFDDCVHERIWLESEQDSVRAVADMLGTTIARHRAKQSLLEAKATLEERVKERTRELQEQVTVKEQVLSQLAETQSSLLEMSRAAGMAEVATGVLHNVGNVLNSVNVSSNLIREQIRQSRVGGVGKVAQLLTSAEGGLPHFFTEDPRGIKIPAYLTSLSAALEKEHQEIANEAEALHHKIDHIKEIVSMQQAYGRVFGVIETVTPRSLMEDALILNAGALARHGIDVIREYDEVPSLTVDKHTIIQILLNFINNAKYACSGNDGPKRVTLRVFSPAPDRIAFQVEDTGVGILPENMDRIFQHGFTTRKKGHGFGLHSGALAAHALGGTLFVDSDGPGCGATFTLEVPLHSGENS